ncbi:MAG: DUF4214 domain-containing protein [Flavobacteriaceae bacterium]|nr:DUF4214 domain-containing protein [Flavobacteriaceae bacterium]
MVTINDPRYSGQWHFDLLGDIETIWSDYSGAGVSVGVYDDGMDQSHEDLASNYDASLHYVGRFFIDNGRHDTSTDGHGTAVGGLIAAAHNGLGGVGVAWDASLTSVDYLGTIQGESWSIQLDVLRYAETFDIVNQSYGVTPGYEALDSGADIGDSGDWAADEAAAFLHAATNGRGGLGTIFVKAAGNEANDSGLISTYGIYGNAQGEGHNNLHTVITVGAFDRNGDIEYYSSYGHNLLVSAPAASNTTDVTGSAGYESGSYTNGFNGTSAATPVTAGVVALMLEANPGLGYRDVQNILAASAAQTGSAFGSSATGFEAGDWQALGGETWNGGAMTFSPSYGFGAVDAYAAVRMAEAWGLFTGTAHTESNLISQSYYDYADVVISNTGAPAEARLSVDAGIVIEHVYVTVDLDHSYSGDLVIDLITPDGDVINLFNREGANSTISDDWTFGVASLRGMSSDGTWTLRVTDLAAGDEGTLRDVELEFLGAAEGTDDIWTVTNDFRVLLAVEGSRASFDDTNGGTDWLNAVALSGNVSVRLGDAATDGALRVDGTVWATLADGAIENAATGDGDDRLAGNAGDNTLFAGRGTNIVTGNQGADVLTGIGTANVLIAEDVGLYGSIYSDQVFRLFDTVFGRAPGEIGHQAYTAQLAAGLVTLEELAATFVAAPEFQLLYGDTTDAEFITLLFQNVFGRNPATKGLEAWVHLLETGTSREEAVALFSETAEHGVRTRAALAAFDAMDPTELTGTVYRLFEAVLGRPPAQEGFAAWVDNLAGGTTLREAVTLFMEGPEFQLRYGETTDAEFIVLLFQNVLGRDPAASGLEAWTGLLEGGMSREEVVTSFMNTAEFVLLTEAELEVFMRGFGQDDYLAASSEWAVLSGGLYADTFAFLAPNSSESSVIDDMAASVQVVTDLEAWDSIELNGFGYASDAEALSHFAQVGDDVVFQDQNMTITFIDTELAMIDEDMLLVA